MQGKNLAPRVLVGMSGGIDSTAACLLLREQGYEPVGVTLRVWGEAPGEAARLAQRLGMEHHVADERVTFRNTVVKYFIDEYRHGRTPNPCVVCNPLIKFRLLTEWADRLGCAHIATGHYARLEKREGKTYILTGDDDKKDQSYFLWRLGQEVLNRCLFPLGGWTKEEVRRYLGHRGFEEKAKEGESMEVCFVPGDYRDFLREQCPGIDQEVGKGWFVSPSGEKIGEHRGAPFYTIGQRKGLGIALGKPAYVLKINAEKNTVMLGDVDRLRTDYMLVDSPQWVDPVEWKQIPDLSVRIRYRSRPLPCRLRPLADGRMLVHFGETASAVAPGQSAVFYQGRRLLGGAFISSQRGIDWIVQQETE